jgi:hypothetical protein
MSSTQSESNALRGKADRHPLSQMRVDCSAGFGSSRPPMRAAAAESDPGQTSLDLAVSGVAQPAVPSLPREIP